ncbi:coiled-coil-helix-coiled-coil-helix domain-containing protein 10, mitochondrial isoform X2 [Helicoverpa armigera]|uniref:CHCH domain-containing protein n=1 Tax=Helicoverpa armigera TaxID=29058 RepID=A0A2W1BXK7_HELAM|nr:coiled-coil-helix-coiled-coil-helix domain-containing protein 10, mitochondrial isoform X1 [Helicoverpa armigera]PZC78374.1 hypothetical protein B5X24_HaOG202197 [Helicoverpa armigera]
MPFGRGRGGGGYRGGRSGYSRGYQHAPARPPPMVVTPMPQRRSMFRDAASIAGGVTVGTAVGHVVGEGITSLFSGSRREEVVHALPRDYDMRSEPSGPCAYEISAFLNCATNHEDIQQCQAFNEALKECKRRNRLP